MAKSLRSSSARFRKLTHMLFDFGTATTSSAAAAAAFLHRRTFILTLMVLLLLLLLVLLFVCVRVWSLKAHMTFSIRHVHSRTHVCGRANE